MFADRLKKSLLQAAIQGKLTEQLPTDGDARDLLKKIRDEKAKLIAAKKIKPEKPLPPVTDDEIPFELPANWCWCRLGEICSYGTNETIQPSAMQVGKILIDLEDVEKDSGKLVNRKTFDGTNANSSKNIFRRGNVLFGKLRVYLNKVIVADADGYCSSEMLPLDFGKNILSRYAQIVLMSPQFLSYANACSYGTKMPRLGTKAGQLALFPLPPLAEQLRIVERLDELLSEVDELAKDERELNLHVKNFPRKMKNSLLQAAIQGKLTEQLSTDGDARDLLKKIRDEKAKLIAAKKIKPEKPLPPVTDDEIPFELPANWCWCRLGEVGIFVSGYTPKNDELTTAGKIPYFKVSDMNAVGNEIWLHKTNLYLKDDFARTYEKNTIVYPKNGGAVFTNKKRILQQDSVVDLNTGGYKSAEDINLMYIFVFFSTINFKMFYKGTALPTLDSKRLREILLPLPPLAEQLRIVERLNELLPLCEI